MGSPATASPADFVATLQLARDVVAAVENDDVSPLDGLLIAGDVAALDSQLFHFAQLLVAKADEVERMRGQRQRLRVATRHAVSQLPPDAYQLMVTACRLADSPCFCGAHVSTCDVVALDAKEPVK